MIPTTIGGPESGPTLFSGSQGGHRVSFGSVFDALFGQGENNETVEMVGMVVLLDQELYRYNNRGSGLSIWELSPKTLVFFIDAPMKMSQHGWQRCLNFPI